MNDLTKPEAILQPVSAFIDEPGFYPNTIDETVRIVLHKPLSIGNEAVREITITRALTASEEDKAGGLSVLTLQQNKVFSNVVHNVTSPMITGNMFMQMPGKDRMAIMRGILSFFD
jgi:hypothetical protein